MTQRVALYARVSTAAQDATPQLVRLREWARDGGFEVVAERVDVASGRHVQRPGMAEILRLARAHRVHAVAVWRIDRWARSIQHLASSVNELHELGVAFHAVDQGLTVRKGESTSRLLLNVLGSVAEWEASIISERTRDGLVGKAGRGRHWRDCGSVSHPCPSGAHKTNGIPPPQETEAAV